jgi:arylsulfatase
MTAFPVRRRRWLARLAGGTAALIATAVIAAAPSRAQLATSTPAPAAAGYPALPTAPHDAPNILLVLTDDTGFGAASAFGGPVPTPNLERLARSGLVYNRFHSTAMCSPTRAALLTGRNHHAVNMGALTDFAVGAEGYNSFIPRSAGTIAEVLRENGYNTAFFGKHHDVPIGQSSAAGPFDLWPTGLGFEYFFGFIGADTDQWHPLLYRGTTQLPYQPPVETLDARLADDAIHWIHQQQAAAPDKPFFVYYAPGSTHTPHQAPADWIARFRGRFDRGWDKVRSETLAQQERLGLIPRGTTLAPRPEGVTAWDTLSPDEKRVQARMMEVYAAELAFQDAQFGRILDELDRMGVRDDTLIMFIEGDNGGDAAAGPGGTLTEVGEIANKRSTVTDKLAMLDTMGGPETELNYSTGWAFAMNAPFPYYKSVASHLGGTRNGMVISWPAGIRGRGIRPQYHHVIDIAPTIYAAVGVVPPAEINGVKQQPIDGIAMEYSFDDPHASDQRTIQYYEMLGNRAIYSHGWLASTVPIRLPWQMGFGAETNVNLSAQYQWQLFNLDTDFSQTHDLAARNPARLREMQRLFDQEAAKYHVEPLDDRTSLARMAGMRQVYLHPRDHYDYWGQDLSVASEAAPAFCNRAFTLNADVIAPAGATGVIAAYGSRFGGWSLYLKDGQPTFEHALSNLAGDKLRLVSSTPLPAGRASRLTLDFDYDGGGSGKGGTVMLAIDGKPVATGRIDRSIVMASGMGEPFDIGHDSGVTVAEALAGDGAFGGTITHVAVTLGPLGARRGSIVAAPPALH